MLPPYMTEQRDIDLKAAINAISDVVQNRPRPVQRIAALADAENSEWQIAFVQSCTATLIQFAPSMSQCWLTVPLSFAP